MPTAESVVLRWRLQALPTQQHLVPRTVLTRMFLYSARVLGSVDGSPVVASGADHPVPGRDANLLPAVDVKHILESGHSHDRPAAKLFDRDM
eukprot:4538483-Amphidinium_carterae.1